MSRDLRESIKGIMAEVFGVDASTIDETSSRETLEQWDSANHINLVFALETELGITLDVDEIESMFSFDDVVQIAGAKL